MIRGFASFWTDRPFFRVTTGLIPSTVWRTGFGSDRANLIGHKLDPDKLERKVPQNLSGLDLHLSILEPMFSPSSPFGKQWIFEGQRPSTADIALWYQLDWGEKICRGEGIQDLTGQQTEDGAGEGAQSVFNGKRYPGLMAWFDRVKKYFENLPSVEKRCERENHAGIKAALESLKKSTFAGNAPLLPTPAGSHPSLDTRNGLVASAEVAVAPDDTGRSSPTIGTLVVITPEEVVITPQKDGSGPAVGDVRIHFPRIGFVVRPAARARL